MPHTLLVLLGPTGSGKTELSLRMAARYGNAPILSADSRQLYRDIPIGTAAPDAAQLAQATHFFVGTHTLTDHYSAGQYEHDVLTLLPQLFRNNPIAILTGGSMMYIDAVCRGIDNIPTVPDDIRQAVWQAYFDYGLQPLLDELQQRDPQHYDEVDRRNAKRVIHAVEICRTAGRPFSHFRTRTTKVRPFRIVKIGLALPTEQLYDRINRRVDAMIAAGLPDEARRLYPFRHLNSLNTVGYKELFHHFDGACTLGEAIDKIKRNSRVYARKQKTWFKRDPDIRWFHPDHPDAIFRYIDDTLNAHR